MRCRFFNVQRNGRRTAKVCCFLVMCCGAHCRQLMVPNHTPWRLVNVFSKEGREGCICVCLQALPSPTEWMEAGERFYHIVMPAKDCKCMKVKRRSCGLLLSSLHCMTQEEHWHSCVCLALTLNCRLSAMGDKRLQWCTWQAFQGPAAWAEAGESFQ